MQLPPRSDEDVAAVLDLLSTGSVVLEGQLVDASNLALLSRVERDGVITRALYKPVDGERPLWDFPDGTLANREVAAFAVSAAGGWNVVPPTVLREDGPAGRGSVQLWIDAVEQDGAGGLPSKPLSSDQLIDVLPPDRLGAGWLPVFEAELSDGRPVVVAHADRPDLASTAVFDAVINNADRKGSHLVLDGHGSLWGFDHGVSFHTEQKLRTVLWGWVGEPLPEVEVERLVGLDRLLADPGSPLAQTLAVLLAPAEVAALRRRVAKLLASRRFPGPGGRWPAVPWPPL